MNHDKLCPVVTYTDCIAHDANSIPNGKGCGVCRRWCECEFIAEVRSDERSKWY